MQVILAQPRGFCAGVERAIEIVERALTLYGPPIYVRHEIVHNGHVVDRLRAKGVRFVEEVDEVPPGSITIFSAHGVSSAVDEAAKARGLKVIDATCPLVARVHLEGARYSRQGRDVVLIGHAGHAEVEGTLGRLAGPVHLVASAEDVAGLKVERPDHVAYITQTTLSVDDTRGIIDALKARFPSIVGPNTDDICYATQNRQRAVLELAPKVDLVLVVGAANSSNSNRLREIAEAAGVPAYLIEDASGARSRLARRRLVGRDHGRGVRSGRPCPGRHRHVEAAGRGARQHAARHRGSVALPPAGRTRTVRRSPSRHPSRCRVS